MSNRLINFKPSEKSKNHIRIVDEIPEIIFDRLESGKEFEFAWVDEPDVDPLDEKSLEFREALKSAKKTDNDYLSALEKLGARATRRQLSLAERELRDRVRGSLGMPPRLKQSVADRARDLGIDPSYDLPKQDKQNKRSHSDSKIQTLLFRESMEAKLSAIREADKTLLDDAGITALYAAFGAIEWFESNDSDTSLFAPLLFVPVEIRRVLENGVYRFILAMREDDIESNQAFGELVREAHSLELPAWNSDNTLAEYALEIERLISSQKRWRLRRWLTVGLFTFAKMSMYRDLDTKRWAAKSGLENHPILVDLLAGAETPSEVLLAGDYDIDTPEILKKTQPLVTDADSSQHSAVIDVSNGQNLVIQGPPGTGKSQTITNIIASALAEGKRVLFVAEKMAALTVVKGRLDSFGLGRFCLEVHSNKTRKTAVAKAFEERLNFCGSGSDTRQLAKAMASLEETRSQLVHYAMKMKEQVGQTGMSVHEVLRANCVRIPIGESLPASVRKIRIAEATSLASSQRAEVFELANQLELSAASIDRWNGLVFHPWKGLENKDLDVLDIQDIEVTLMKWKESLARLTETVSTINDETEWAIEPTVHDAEKFVTAVSQLSDPPSDLSTGFLRECFSEDGHSRLKDAADCIVAMGETSETLRRFFFDDWNQELSEEALSNIVSRAKQLELQSMTVGMLRAHLSETEANTERLAKAKQALATVNSHFLIHEPRIRDARQVFSALMLLTAIPPSDLDRRASSIVDDGHARSLERGAVETVNFRSAESLIAADFALDSLPPPADLRFACSVLGEAGFFARLFSSDYRRAKRIYDSIALSSAGRSGEAPNLKMGRLLRHIDQKQSIERDQGLRNAAGEFFAGVDTPWRQLLNVSKWASKVRSTFETNQDGARYTELLLAGAIANLSNLRSLVQEKNVLADLRVLMEVDLSDDSPLGSVVAESKRRLEEKRDVISDLTVLRLRDFTPIADIPMLTSALAKRARMLRSLNSPELRALFMQLPAEPDAALRTIGLAQSYLAVVNRAQVPDSVKKLFAKAAAQPLLAALKHHAAQLAVVLRTISENQATASTLATLNENDWIGGPIENINTGTIVSRIEHALRNKSALHPYLDFLRIRAAVEATSLVELGKYLEFSKPAYSGLAQAYDFAFFRSCADAVLADDPLLRSHAGVTHEQLRKKYQQFDRRIMRLRQTQIAEKLAENAVPQGNSRGRSSEITELALIMKQISLQRKHAPLRDLFKRAGAAAQALKPCFMMSPMSVSQFLDPSGIEFDLVVMDEASQIRPEDALGAIARGKQLVVVGDPMQLPPTSFFEKVDRDETNDEDPEAADIHDLTSQESILDLARGPYQPIRQLRWHYRSQHEGLIAFSNHEFYDDSLVIFPSPRGQHPDFGVKMHPVRGVYEAGLNRIEGEAVVHAAQLFMKEFPKRSLGIVAINKAQQELMQGLIDQMFAEDLDAENYRLRWEGTLEPVFVKNLENVQGDERDVIFISTVYGKDSSGNFFQRLGPINGVHGHRRLNVLFTRAKQQVVLFTSMQASDIRLEMNSRLGVKALKGYLAYAQTGRLSTEQLTGKQADSEFETWVMEMLHEAGYETVPQLGVAGYFIDIAVRHPDNRGSFILGVECDGAMYHSARSVRDRDRLRQEVLERLDWNIYRIWSTDWFRNPRIEFEKLQTMLEKLRRTDRPGQTLDRAVD
jgi:very-short-patch-repair endonuclease